MKVKELIAELQKYPNQEAELNIISNLIDVDNDAFDVEKCHIECAQQDIKDAPIYDIYVCRDENEIPENANIIRDAIYNSDWVTIEIDNEEKCIEIRNEYGIIYLNSFQDDDNSIMKLLSLL